MGHATDFIVNSLRDEIKMGGGGGIGTGVLKNNDIKKEYRDIFSEPNYRTILVELLSIIFHGENFARNYTTCIIRK